MLDGGPEGEIWGVNPHQNMQLQVAARLFFSYCKYRQVILAFAKLFWSSLFFCVILLTEFLQIVLCNIIEHFVYSTCDWYALQRNGSRCRSVWMKQLGFGSQLRMKPGRQSLSWSSFRSVSPSVRVALVTELPVL